MRTRLTAILVFTLVIGTQAEIGITPSYIQVLVTRQEAFIRFYNINFGWHVLVATKLLFLVSDLVLKVELH